VFVDIKLYTIIFRNGFKTALVTSHIMFCAIKSFTCVPLRFVHVWFTS